MDEIISITTWNVWKFGMLLQAESGKDDTPSNKIAALEAQIKQQVLQISTLTSSANNNTGIFLPPAPNNDPLQPPAGFSQRGAPRK